MNIKQFLVCKISEKFPGEVNEIIWESLKNTSVSQITNLYYYKVAKNRDIFVQLLDMAEYELEVIQEEGDETQLYYSALDWDSETADAFYSGEWVVDIKKSEKQRIVKFIKYAKNNITYKYIQEPGAWLNAIRTVREIFFITKTWNPAITDSFWGDLKYILDKVRFENSVYQQWTLQGTGVMWWDY